MIIHALSNYYYTLFAKGEAPPFGWNIVNVSHGISINENGDLIDIAPIFVVEKDGKKEREVPIKMTVPERVVRSGTKLNSNFLCDNTSYFLGIDKGNKIKIKNFEDFKKLHLTLLKNIDNPVSNGIKNFFSNWKPEENINNQMIKSLLEDKKISNLVFMVNGKYAHDDSQIKEAWNDKLDREKLDSVLCVTSGKVQPQRAIHAKIKLRGAQSAGANLISYNAKAYDSYGNDGSMNAPMGEKTSFAHTTAINLLLSDFDHKQSIGIDTLVYWSEDASEKAQDTLNLFAFTKENENKLLYEMMKRLKSGKPINSDVDLNQRFYILCLSPNAARISIRFFLQDTFSTFLKNIAMHYEQLEVIKPKGNKIEYLTPYWLLKETVNPKSKDKKTSPLLSGAVLNSILTGAPYPTNLCQLVLIRVKARQSATPGQAAIIKAYLIRNQKHSKEDITVSLNKENKTPAYVLGRLFSVLEHLQERANNGTSTIRKRYFTSACTTPSIGFAKLMRNSNHHLAKLDDKSRIYFSKEIGNLIDKINISNEASIAFPSNHNSNEQLLFVIGDYHQTQNRYIPKSKED